MITLTESRSLVEPKSYEPGTGGLPPVNELPNGLGGGGGDDWSQEWDGPWRLTHQTRFFVICALLGDLFIFATLALIASSRGALAQGTAPAAKWLPPVLFLNAATLLLSSAAMEAARRNIFREVDVLEEWLGLGRPALQRALPWLGAAFGLGALFLAGQALAWKQLAANGIVYRFSQSSALGYDFFQISGVHALHMAFCLAVALFGLAQLGRFKNAEYRQVFVDAAAWCWHAMTFVWIAMLAVLIYS